MAEEGRKGTGTVRGERVRLRMRIGSMDLMPSD